jgi:uncharacterized membrane protein
MDELDLTTERTVTTNAFEGETATRTVELDARETRLETDRDDRPSPLASERGADAWDTEDETALDVGPSPVPSLAAIAGHPIHPMVVPLPIGAFVFAFASDLAYRRTHDAFWARAAKTLTGAGIATGLLAGSLGAIDFLGRERVRQHGEAWIHAGGNVAALGLAGLSYALRRRDGRQALPTALLLSATCVSILGVTGWLGGELSYRYRIGVTDR